MAFFAHQMFLVQLLVEIPNIRSGTDIIDTRLFETNPRPQTAQKLFRFGQIDQLPHYLTVDNREVTCVHGDIDIRGFFKQAGKNCL